ncbi:Methionine ABC transporter substrate-binding protein [plant metagenome]|uniref:Methionine ABC transporter substrate-binding protein n=1 Tax=plant metagenome TaxID=1297885 RepID=A0A484U9X0_9ZZZZ
MMISPRRAFLSSLMAVLAATSLPAWAATPDKKNLVIGATAGSNVDVLKLGIVPQLAKQGYSVKVVEFNDYVQPNLALAQGSLDVNYFQHIIYLKKFATDQKLDLTEIVQGPIAPLGIYSQKRKSLKDLQDGDRITLPNDPSNLARALVLLQDQGLIKVKADVDPLRVTEKDITENPRKLRLQPIEAAQLPRTLGDAEYAIINGNFAISSGLKLTEAVVLEQTPDHYLLVAAVRTADRDTPWAKDVAAAFKTDFFKQVLEKDFPGYARPAFLK